MNAPHAFDENATSTPESGSGNDRESPFISEEVVKRRARRLFMERFEQAFFVGLLLTLISFTVYIVLSEYSTPSAMAASQPMPALTSDEKKVRVTWDEEPAFEVPVVPQMEDSETYPIVGETVDTTWIASEEESDALESSPYVKEESPTEKALEPVPAPATTETAITTAVDMRVGGVPMEAYLGQHDSGLVVETTPGSEEASVEPPAQVAPREPVRIGVLRVGGGHARDLVRLYTDPAVVYGLE